MATNNHTTTFWHFLENYSIEIPIIQRDYAQGRIGKENLRKNFLNDLKEALDKSKEMKLDFVYGSTENGNLYPLDGQQRLTTLWLLHWYIALRAGKLKEASNYLKNFSYETRVSSRNFCEEMCKPENFKNHNLKNTVVEFIINQTWFYSAWKQDPTIQSMLRMLGGSKQKNNIDDGIEKVFDCSGCIQSGNFTEGLNRSENCPTFINYYTILTSEKCPIVFYYLPKDFGNSDDLYVKMNARGEQLTSFENFKADLIGYIKKQSEDEKDENKQTEWENLLDPEGGIPLKMDTDWTNIFWTHKSKDYNIDDIYFAFLNRFFLDYRFLDVKDENDKRYTYFTGNGYNNNDNAIAYETIDDYESNNVIDLDLFIRLKNTLNNYSDSKIDESTDILRYNNKWNPKFFFIPRYDDEEKQELIKNAKGDFVKKIFTLTQKERVAYYAICKYFIQGPVEQNDNKELDYTSLKRWMRFVWNLVSVQTADRRDSIRSVAEMKNAIILINEIQKPHAVYESLNKFDESNYSGTILKDQFAEEIAKAKQILSRVTRTDGKSWEIIIMEAESYAFFKGAIRFLFTDEKGDVNDQSWQHFDTKWTNVQKFFKNGEVASTISIAKYFSDDQIKEIYGSFSFKTENWKSILIEKSISKPIHQFLLGETVNNTSVLYTDIKNILDSINTQDVWLLPDWQHCEVVLTNYSTRRSEPYNGYVFQVGNKVRNKWNNIISKISEIEVRVPQAWGDEKIEINGQVYYRGLWTDMMYKDCLFRYFGNNTVCLMTDDGACKILKNDKESDKPENTYYFEVTEDFFNNNKNILEYLKHLITQADKDK